MRGGTVRHKLHCAPARRYSEDLDLVQIDAGPIGAVDTYDAAIVDILVRTMDMIDPPDLPEPPRKQIGF